MNKPKEQKQRLYSGGCIIVTDKQLEELKNDPIWIKSKRFVDALNRKPTSIKDGCIKQEWDK